MQKFKAIVKAVLIAIVNIMLAALYELGCITPDIYYTMQIATVIVIGLMP